ncbi:MAG: hypothetical protein WA981_12215 [Glaciecola sp.]
MIQLTHIGEHLIAKMLSTSKEARSTLLNTNDTAFNLFEPEIRLNPLAGLIFDGAHKIDVSVLNPSTGECIAIESKLGLDRMSKTEFEKRFLAKCETSHDASRVKGTMISVLERQLPSKISGEKLTVTYKDLQYKVADKWILIVRRKIKNRWQLRGKPPLSQNCKVIVFEDIVDSLGGERAFNKLTNELISQNHYIEWSL